MDKILRLTKQIAGIEMRFNMIEGWTSYPKGAMVVVHKLTDIPGLVQIFQAIKVDGRGYSRSTKHALLANPELVQGTEVEGPILE